MRIIELHIGDVYTHKTDRARLALVTGRDGQDRVQIGELDISLAAKFPCEWLPASEFHKNWELSA